MNFRMIVSIDPIVDDLALVNLPIGQFVIGARVKVNDYLKIG